MIKPDIFTNNCIALIEQYNYRFRNCFDESQKDFIKSQIIILKIIANERNIAKGGGEIFPLTPEEIDYVADMISGKSIYEIYCGCQGNLKTLGQRKVKVKHKSYLLLYIKNKIVKIEQGEHKKLALKRQTDNIVYYNASKLKYNNNLYLEHLAEKRRFKQVLRGLWGMKFREHIINSIQYIEDIDHLKDYAQSIQEIETLDDAKYRTMHIVNKMCEYEGIEKMYPFVPHDDILEMYARIEVKAELEGIGIEPAKQRELQI